MNKRRVVGSLIGLLALAVLIEVVPGPQQTIFSRPIRYAHHREIRDGDYWVFDSTWGIESIERIRTDRVDVFNLIPPGYRKEP